MEPRRIHDPHELKSLLTDSEWRVRSIDDLAPGGLRGSVAGEIFRRFARMSDGDSHTRRRYQVDILLGGIDLDSVPHAADEILLRLMPVSPCGVQYALPGMIVAHLLGISPGHQLPIVRIARALVVASRPDATPKQSLRAVSAMEKSAHILADAGTSADEITLEYIAAQISLIFQASDACAALVGNALMAAANEDDSPRLDAAHVVRKSMESRVPVRCTNRFRGGERVVLDLEAAHHREPDAGWTFGYGPHACPGRALAITIATACVDSVLRLRPFNLLAIRQKGWEDVTNLWIPILAIEKGDKR